jgi:transitional endoplasmic reticulum ATPase
MKDIIGLKDAKRKIRERLIDYYENKDLYEEYGLPPSCGILLYGSSSVGKTSLAKSVIRKYGNRFDCMYTEPNDFVQSQQGATVAKMHSIFEKIRNSKKDVVLILDEIDGIFPKRGSSHSPITDIRVSAFLREVGGIFDNGKTNLFIIATSNRPHKIETAILSGARISTMIYVRLPNDEERKLLIDKYITRLPIEKQKVDLHDILLKYTKGYTGGDYKSLGSDILAKYITNKKKGVNFVHIKDVVELTNNHHKTLEMNIKKIKDFGRRYEATYGSGERV